MSGIATKKLFEVISGLTIETLGKNGGSPGA